MNKKSPTKKKREKIKITGYSFDYVEDPLWEEDDKEFDRWDNEYQDEN